MARLKPVGLDRVVAWARAANALADPDHDGYAGRTDFFEPNVRTAHCKACAGILLPDEGVPWMRFYRGGWVLSPFFLCASCDAAVVRAVPPADKLVFS